MGKTYKKNINRFEKKKLIAIKHKKKYPKKEEENEDEETEEIFLQTLRHEDTSN